MLNILQYMYGHASILGGVTRIRGDFASVGLPVRRVELNLATSAISHQSHTGRRETTVRRRRRPVAAGGRFARLCLLNVRRRRKMFAVRNQARSGVKLTHRTFLGFQICVTNAIAGDQLTLGVLQTGAQAEVIWRRAK